MKGRSFQQDINLLNSPKQYKDKPKKASGLGLA